MTDILPQISAWILIGIGLALMSVEIFTAMFILLFFGLAFVIVGIVAFSVAMPGEVQILSAMLLGGLLTFALRKWLLQYLQADDLSLETLKTGEVGVLQEFAGELRVSYKGTTWPVQPHHGLELKAGDSVIVTELVNNMASIQKID